MLNDYDTCAQKEPINLTVNSDLLRIAKDLKINVSATLEKSLVDKVREQRQQIWLTENKQAMSGCNQLIDKNSVFSDQLRRF